MRSTGLGGDWIATTADRSTTAVIATLHAHHYLSMVRLAVALVDDESAAEDAVQDAFVALLRAWPLRDEGAAEYYLRRAVVNACRDRLRHRRVRRQTALPQGPVEPSPEQLAMTAADQRALLNCLRALPERQREVLVLRYFSELSEAEIASTLGVSTGTVKSTAHKGIAALRSALEQEKP
jgi:RNA polymerase sigma-70 factor (sigma-E family)